jgi:Domain of unknown function (DUF4136)
MSGLSCALVFLLLAPQKVGEVESHFDKKANFSAFHTYAWAKGHDAYDPAAHKAIIAAIEAQMTSLGFTKVDQSKADVFLTYHTVRSAEMDLKMLDKLQKEGQDTAAATKMIGRLAVVLSQPASREMLWSAGTRRRISDDPSKRNDELQSAVTALFETYPGRKKKASN